MSVLHPFCLEGKNEFSAVLDDFPGFLETFHCSGDTYAMGSCEKAQIFVGEWELNGKSLFTFEPMFTSNVYKHTVESILQVCEGQAAYPMCKPVDASAKIFYDLQPDVGMFQDESFEVLPGKAADEHLLHARSGHRIVDFFAEHVFTQEIAGLANIERDLGPIFRELAQLYPANFDK